MARIVIKNGFLKGGSAKATAHLDNLIKYIATRDGVDKTEIAHKHWNTTTKQKSLIEQIICEFPDAKETLEYEDYLNSPNRKNASEFIAIALEQNLYKACETEKYIDYISNRPRVEKFERHGLFSSKDEPLVLSEVAKEVANHEGNVWTPIISLRREDAEKFGFESAYAWKALLSSKVLEIGESFKIHPDNLKCYAAFHNESHHPHVHMVCYSKDQAEGYLTKQGIQKMKSTLANEIFKQELIPLYSDKTQKRDHLKEQSSVALKDMVLQMQNRIYENQRIEELLLHLADRLQYLSGKLQYGYLKPKLKNVVDEIVDELARDEKVALAYRLWFETKGLIDNIYTNAPTELQSLSKNDDFKSIRNMVVSEAVKIMRGEITFEGEPIMVAQEDEKEFPPRSFLEKSAQKGNAISAYLLGKLYLGGTSVIKDEELALYWLKVSAGKENQYAQYTLGSLYLKGSYVSKNIEVAISYLESAAKKNNEAAMYLLSKLYLTGEDVQKDIDKALFYLTQIAEKGNQYAQYLLGKVYLFGKDVPKDKDLALNLFTLSALQNNNYAEFFVDIMNKAHNPSVALSVSNLFRHLGRIFADNVATLKTTGQQVDRKLLRKLQEKKRAQGHAKDDHSQTVQSF